ncbi:hypothetical protein GOX2672 (plasmid) [Gluconobacter oxydans 621H]|uniref:Uncharacterized protein n=1 Tax=Gluconobacter oxydans (strain 621H) TaxID=290633 RepID=Q5HXL7_GLUOX|nr:hypothetical protein GOX2672 [Gluconobacter oxydans 621H]
MKLRVQAAFCASDMAGKSPFLSRDAAVLCALRCVASIIKRFERPAFSVRATKIRSKTPRRLHRMKRLYKVLCGPYAFGASFH